MVYRVGLLDENIEGEAGGDDGTVGEATYVKPEKGGIFLCLSGDVGAFS